MDGFERVADQNYILVMPVASGDEFRVEPERPVRDQGCAIEKIFEDVGADQSALLVAGSVQTGFAPTVLAAFYDERSQVRIETIAVGDERAKLRRFEYQANRLKPLRRGIPNPLVEPGLLSCLEMVVQRRSHRAVHTVSPDDEIVILE